MCLYVHSSALTKLEGLNLSYNRMRGDFPDQLSSMVSLKLLSLEGNIGMTALPPTESGKPLQVHKQHLHKLLLHTLLLHQCTLLFSVLRQHRLSQIVVAID
jgi:hypothetical protein